MTQTEAFIQRLQSLQAGEQSRLRRLAGQPLDETLPGFDLFTGLWWPLRQRSPAVPRREPSWLVAKVFGAFPLPDAPAARLASVLGRCEPRDELGRDRFRARFDSLLQTPSSRLERPLLWALSVAADVVAAGRARGIAWAQLLDDLSIWERGEQHRRRRDVRDDWAEQYLKAVYQPERS